MDPDGEDYPITETWTLALLREWHMERMGERECHVKGEGLAERNKS